jgi:hypothetical protein
MAGVCNLSAPSSAGGQCEAIVTRYWHDPLTGLCVPYLTNWCYGGDGLFDTRAECESICGGGGANWGTCEHDYDCGLVNLYCDCTPVNASSFLGLRADRTTNYMLIYGSGSFCEECMVPNESRRSLQFFLPVCRAGLCSVLDVRGSELAACERDEDCALRDGAGCCPECDGQGWVSLNANAALCEGPSACDACVGPPPPAGYGSSCINGHCSVIHNLQ